MSDLIRTDDIKKLIVPLRGADVILDVDVAALYGVTTREVNQAIRNNPDKFPEGFVFALDKKELTNLRSNFLTANLSPKSRVMPKAITEKGLYMLATILKSKIATRTTLAIINTFAEVRELKRNLLELHDSSSHEDKKKGMSRIGDILADLIMPDVETTETQSSLEFNFVIGKLKHSVTRQRKASNSDLILREKVEFAKRLLSKGFQEAEVIELANLTEADIKKINDII